MDDFIEVMEVERNAEFIEKGHNNFLNKISEIDNVDFGDFIDAELKMDRENFSTTPEWTPVEQKSFDGLVNVNRFLILPYILILLENERTEKK